MLISKVKKLLPLLIHFQNLWANPAEFRIEKIIKKKGDKRYVK